VPVANETDDLPGAVRLPIRHVDGAREQSAALGASTAGRVGCHIDLDQAEHSALAGDCVQPQRVARRQQTCAAAARAREVARREGIAENARRESVSGTRGARERRHRAIADLHLVTATEAELRSDAGRNRGEAEGGREEDPT
jgi:hypothetical protein